MRTIDIVIQDNRVTGETEDLFSAITGRIAVELRTQNGELVMDDYENVGSGLYDMLRNTNNQVEDIEPVLSEALDSVISEGLISGYGKVGVTTVKNKLRLSFVVYIGDQEIIINT